MGKRAISVPVTCEVCLREEYVKPSRAKTYKTCSRECMGVRLSRLLTNKESIVCCICGTAFNVKPSSVKRRKCCSKMCAAEYRKQIYAGKGNPNYGNRGEKCAAWRGGRRMSNYGYVLLHKPGHPNARPDGYVFEHRYVMSEYLGRPLLASEDVHHKDGDKTNNSIENLQILSRSEHTKHHNKSRNIIRGDRGRIAGIA